MNAIIEALSVNQAQDEQNNQMALVLASQLQAEVQAAVIQAERSPRDWDQVRQKLLRECKRTSFAKAARYNKPIGAGVQGFSIRFAEAAIGAAKHIHTTTRTIWEDDEQRKILVKVWDAQEGISYADEITIEKTIERRSIPGGAEVIRTRKNKSGDLLYILRATEDDLLNKVNAAKSKSIRNSGLRLIPGWLQEEALQEIRATVKLSDEQNPDAAKQEIFDAFGELGVDVASLKKFLGHDAQVLTPKELQTLRGLYAELRDGQATMFEVLQALEREKERNREREAAAMKGPEGTAVAVAGATTQSVKEKILNREKKPPVSTIDGSPSSSSPAGESKPTPQS
ncbi:MAG TPA: hypothetical protein VE957_06930 [Terriglobales bacterium]|nr:hypothetical protein [Terriglobales bacterium]